jgi:HSP20 family molecular chaperone IbpA
MNDTNVETRETPAREQPALLPPVDVFEDPSGITLVADLPGVPKDRLSLRIEADTLTLEGEVALPTPEGLQPSHVEVQLPRYRRVFALSKELDPAKITAELKNGVLKLRIPRAEHLQPRRIEVQVA